MDIFFQGWHTSHILRVCLFNFENCFLPHDFYFIRYYSTIICKAISYIQAGSQRVERLGSLGPLQSEAQPPSLEPSNEMALCRGLWRAAILSPGQPPAPLPHLILKSLTTPLPTLLSLSLNCYSSATLSWPSWLSPASSLVKTKSPEHLYPLFASSVSNFKLSHNLPCFFHMVLICIRNNEAELSILFY